MNQFYRIIWNSTLQCFVVASEFAKSKGKAASKVVAALVLSSLFSTSYAQVVTQMDLATNTGSSNAINTSSTTNNSTTSSQPMSPPFTADMLSRTASNTSNGISNFASPGTEDNDTVTVSQLRPLVNSLGGGAKIDIVNGTVTGPQYMFEQIDKTTGASKAISTPFTTVGSALDSLGTSLSNLSNSALRYVDSNSKTTIKLDGGEDANGQSGTTITNLKGGEVSTASSDAINGSQLYNTNSNMVKYLGGDANVDSKGNWTEPTYQIKDRNRSDENGDPRIRTVHNVGDAITLLDGGITGLANNINNGSVGLIKRDPVTNNLTVDAEGEGNNISFSGVNGARILDGVKDGALSSESKEAVNGSQLFNTNNNVEQNSKNIGAMAHSLGGGASVGADGQFVAPSYKLKDKTANTVEEALNILNGGIGDLANNINDGSVGLVKQDAVSKNITVATESGGNSVSIKGTDGERTLTGLKDAALDDTSSDAVNGKQLFTTKQDVQKNNNNIINIAKNLGGDAAVDKEGNFVAPEYNVQGEKKSNVSDAISGLDSGITQNAGDITELTSHIKNGTLGLVQQATPESNITVAASSAGSSVSFMGMAGSRRLTDVSKGLSDEDAVNIGQLKDLLSEFGSNGSIDSATGKITGPTYKINGKDLSLSSSLTDLDNRIGELGNGGDIGNTDHLIAYDDKEHKSVTLGGKDSDSSVSLGNVADGKVEKDSKDAVNGGQLHEVKNQVAQNTTDINNIKNNVDGITNGSAGLVQQDPKTNDITVGKDKAGDKVSFANNAGKDRILSGVANGVADNDAATIGQVKDLANASTSSTLAANNTSKRAKPIASGKDTIALGAGSQSSADNSISLGSNAKASGNNSVALGNDSIADRANSLSVGSVGKERQITNVGRGTSGTDAVNLNQLNEGLSALNDNTNQHFRDIDKNINHLKNQLRGGIASAMAMGSLPQPYSAGSGMMSMGGATFHGESAMAIGASKVSEDGRWVTKLQGSTNTQGDFGVSAGVGFQW